MVLMCNQMYIWPFIIALTMFPFKHAAMEPADQYLCLPNITDHDIFISVRMGHKENKTYLHVGTDANMQLYSINKKILKIPPKSHFNIPRESIKVPFIVYEYENNNGIIGKKTTLYSFEQQVEEQDFSEVTTSQPLGALTCKTIAQNPLEQMTRERLRNYVGSNIKYQALAYLISVQRSSLLNKPD